MEKRKKDLVTNFVFYEYIIIYDILDSEGREECVDLIIRNVFFS